MAHLLVFNNVSLDGYFQDANRDMSWAQAARDDELTKFTEENAKGGGILLFGRKTYDMMASFWPTPMAAQSMPKVAEAMNKDRKVAFSRTMKRAEWSNTEISADPVATVKELKRSGAEHMVVMGSGEIVALLVREKLVDELQLIVHPLTLGAGRTLFDSASRWTLTKSRTFKNGCVHLCYAPV